MTHVIEEVDRVEILTLQDNYIDLVARDNSDVIQRGIAVERRGGKATAFG